MRNSRRAGSTASPARERGVLRSVTNALSVLEAFSVERPEQGVTELAHALGLGKSTVHRLLASLAARGYVRRNPETERYSLGLKAFDPPDLLRAVRKGLSYRAFERFRRNTALSFERVLALVSAS